MLLKLKKLGIQAAIDSVKSEISKLEKVVLEQQRTFREQSSYYQTNGARSYVDFLLNAENLSDIVNRIGVVMDLIGANRDLMQQQAEDKKQAGFQRRANNKLN